MLFAFHSVVSFCGADVGFVSIGQQVEVGRKIWWCLVRIFGFAAQCGRMEDLKGAASARKGGGVPEGIAVKHAALTAAQGPGTGDPRTRS